MGKNLPLVLGLAVVALVIFLGVWMMVPKATNTNANTNTTLETNTTNTTTNTQQNTNTATTNSANIYLVAIGDDGQIGTKIGCGDSLVPIGELVSTSGTSTQADTASSIEASLTTLFTLNDQYYGPSGLYNALYQSHLVVGEVTVTNGLATVPITGAMTLGGECDNPRVESQITQTVRQFSTVTSANISLNGKSLSEALSLK